MLSKEEAERLSDKLERIECVDVTKAQGLFLYVMKGEPADQADKYQNHISNCEYCRIALELFRYQRDAAALSKKWEKGKEILDRVAKGDVTVRKKGLSYATAYFEPGQNTEIGTTLLVDHSGIFLSVESQTLADFEKLIRSRKHKV